MHVLNQSLLNIIANQGYSPRLPCHHCQELDHRANEWALAPLEQPTKAPTRSRPPSYPRSGRRLARMTRLVLPTAISSPLTPLSITPVSPLVELSAHAFVSRGIRDSVHSKGPAHMRTSVPHVTADPTKRGTAPGPQLTHTSRG